MDEEYAAPLTQEEEKQVNAAVKSLSMMLRRLAVKRCLSGNDVGCFTVEQYADAYVKEETWYDPDVKERHKEYIRKLAPMHLRSVGMQELSPGVWGPKTEKELNNGTGR